MEAGDYLIEPQTVMTDEIGAVTPKQVAGWFRKAAKRGPVPSEAHVLALTVRINDLRRSRLDPNTKRLEQLADNHRYRIDKIRRALAVLEHELPRLIALSVWWQRLSHEWGPLENPMLPKRPDYLFALLSQYARQAEIYLADLRGSRRKTGRPTPLWHRLAIVLGELVVNAWLRAGPRKLSLEPDGPLVVVLACALEAVEGKRRSPAAISQVLKRWRRQLARTN